LQSEWNAIAKQLQSEWKASSKRLQSDCNAIMKRLRSDYAAIAKRLQSDCKAIPERLQSDCRAIAKRSQSDRKADGKRLQSDCKATAKRLQSDYKATAKRLHSDCKATAKRMKKTCRLVVWHRRHSDCIKFTKLLNKDIMTRSQSNHKAIARRVQSAEGNDWKVLQNNNKRTSRPESAEAALPVRAETRWRKRTRRGLFALSSMDSPPLLPHPPLYLFFRLLELSHLRLRLYLQQ
jgi:hypothetical protein